MKFFQKVLQKIPKFNTEKGRELILKWFWLISLLMLILGYIIMIYLLLGGKL